MRDANNNRIPDGVEEFVSEAWKDVREIGRQVRARADEAKTDAVKGLNGAADNIRREARDKKLTGEALKGADDTAAQLEKAAAYLKRRSIDDIGQDINEGVTRSVRRNPLPTLAIVLIVGVVIGLLLSRRD